MRKSRNWFKSSELFTKSAILFLWTLTGRSARVTWKHTQLYPTHQFQKSSVRQSVRKTLSWSSCHWKLNFLERLLLTKRGPSRRRYRWKGWFRLSILLETCVKTMFLNVWPTMMTSWNSFSLRESSKSSLTSCHWTKWCSNTNFCLYISATTTFQSCTFLTDPLTLKLWKFRFEI